MNEEPAPIISLEDNSIIPIYMYDKNHKNYMFRVENLNGSTEVINFLGFETMEESGGKYQVFASVAKYSCLISHMPEFIHKSLNEEPSNPKKAEILFSGTINIYEKNKIFGQELYERVNDGIIHLSRPNEQRFTEKGGLKNVIFDSGLPPQETIEAILTGLCEKENQRESNRISRENEAYRSGRDHDNMP